MRTEKTKTAELKKLAYDYVYHVTRRNFYSANNDFENRNYHENQINTVKNQINKIIESNLVTKDEMIFLIHNTAVN